jgi:hypothetical protein
MFPKNTLGHHEANVKTELKRSSNVQTAEQITRLKKHSRLGSSTHRKRELTVTGKKQISTLQTVSSTQAKRVKIML